jgi:hypothetical protein
LDAYTNSSYFCTPLRPPSPLPSTENPSTTYCPIPAGPFGFSFSIPWDVTHRLQTTLDTRFRAVDPSSNEILCVDILTTPLQPTSRSPYGRAIAILFITLTLVVAYWLLVATARIASAWNRGISRQGTGLGAKLENAGFILASAISGERLATSPALLRFCTFLSFHVIHAVDERLFCTRYTLDARHSIPYSVVRSARYGGRSMAGICLYVLKPYLVNQRTNHDDL